MSYYKCGIFKDAFTRFSVTMFSSMVDALDDAQKEVTKKFGFGSLLHFQTCYVPKTCYVPNKFVKWLAQNVNWKSADIILKGKVISLITESVHLILGLPIGGSPFPLDNNAGKSRILSKFDKLSVPHASKLSKTFKVKF